MVLEWGLSIYLPLDNGDDEVLMDIFISAVLIVAYLTVAVLLIVRDIRSDHSMGIRLRLASAISVLSAILFSVDMLAGPGVGLRLPLDLTLSLVPMLLLTSSLWEVRRTYAWIGTVAAFEVGLIAVHVMTAVGIISFNDPMWAFNLAHIPIVVASLLFLFAIWRRVRVVKEVIKSATVWTCLTLSVDTVYILAASVQCLLLVNAINLGLLPILSILIAGGYVAMGVRICQDSVFVIMDRHERCIIESMKISQVEVSNVDTPEKDMHKELYERIQVFFDEEKPYLNSALTINDVVKVVYTNKLYISKAISQYTGRNFCQFVNYYRVMFSIEMFRRNPDVKVAEMALNSGFNSVASYSMAFRLFMGENPSEWCRKEKYRMSKNARNPSADQIKVAE